MEEGLTCRYCGRPIAVPASRCPWCGRTIMVICARCKQYTDDQETVCQHCGAPLEPDQPEGLHIGVGLDDQIARLITDRRRAHLVASAVVVQDFTGFFYSDGQRRTVLVDLFGPSPDLHHKAAALLFAAIAYLVHQGYCALRLQEDGHSLIWAEERPWDGQAISLESALARQAGLGQNLLQALRQVITEETSISPGPLRGRGPTTTFPMRSIAEAVIELARRTVLPEYPRTEAYRETYRILANFVRRDPALARRIAEQILDTLAWAAGIPSPAASS